MKAHSRALDLITLQSQWASAYVIEPTHPNDYTPLNHFKSGNRNLSPAHSEDHDTAMTPATTNSFYLQHSQNGGIYGKSLNRPAYADSGDDQSGVLAELNESVDAGRREPEVYERTLQSWRAAIRRPIVRMVEKESHTIAVMQVLQPPCSAINPSAARYANDACLLYHVIGPTEDAVVGHLLCIHLELGNPHVFHDRCTDFLLLRPA